MEKEVILKWLSGSGDGSGSGYGYGYGSGSGSGSGYGYGYGSGSGYGYGYGDGSGYSSGDGSGYGTGSGYGYGYGDGSGYSSGDGYGTGSGDGYRIKAYRSKEDVVYVDNIPTIIRSIRGDYAKGFVINDDFSITPCWVARWKEKMIFAHGKDLHDAVSSLNRKIANSMTAAERVDLFCSEFKKGELYKGTVFFDWHNRLTGSCLFGRTQFVQNKGFDLDQEYSVDDFITITENEYGSDVIKLLKTKWKDTEPEQVGNSTSLKEKK